MLAIDIDRNQVNYYAIASRPDADLVGETLACVNRGKRKDNERYCWLYPSREAFEYANVNPSTGDFDHFCAIAYGGRGVDVDRSTRDDISVPDRYLYDAEGCPGY